MKTMSEGAKVSIQKIGDWFVWAANAIGKFNDWELRRAERGVKEIADGNYDWRIERYENRHGLSR